MALLERKVKGNFADVRKRLEEGILAGSISATLEGGSDFCGEQNKCSVRVFERYSAIGSNRVSLTLTLYQDGDGPIQISAITSGGSQAMFFKINTLGEEAFLQKLEALLQEEEVV